MFTVHIFVIDSARDWQIRKYKRCDDDAQPVAGESLCVRRWGFDCSWILALRASFFMLKSRVSRRISGPGCSGSPSDAPEPSTIAASVVHSLLLS